MGDLLSMSVSVHSTRSFVDVVLYVLFYDDLLPCDNWLGHTCGLGIWAGWCATVQSNVMKRLSKTMIHRAMYIEDMQLLEFLEEISAAINITTKSPVTAGGLLTVWKQKGPDSLRTKLQSLARRKRGQWASFAKSYLDATFLPHQPLPVKKSKGRKGDDDDDDEDGCVEDDSIMSSAGRLERFETGLLYQINRSTLPNGACCLSVSTTKRTSDRYV